MNDKLISEFMLAGCGSRKDAAVTLQVYLDLCEVKRYWDVEYKYDDSFKLLYLTAKKKKAEDDSIFVPIALSENLSFNKVREYFRLCPKNCETKRLFVVIVTSDSTCVYYQITEGLHEPTEASSGRNIRENKQERIDSEINKHRAVIEQAAMCGLPITLPRKSSGKTEESTKEESEKEEPTNEFSDR